MELSKTKIEMTLYYSFNVLREQTNNRKQIIEWYLCYIPVHNITFREAFKKKEYKLGNCPKRWEGVNLKTLFLYS